MPTITSADGVRLSYTETGDPAGRPVVLIAGFKAPATSWVYQQRPLQRAGYRVLAFDRRGHGESGAAPSGDSMDRHGSDIHDLLVALDLQDASIVGGSMGGNSVWAMADRFGTDRVRSIVIVDQTPRMLNADDWTFGYYGYDASNADTLFAEGVRDPGRHSVASKGPVRIGRILRALAGGRAVGGKPSYSPAELELLGDHARRDWRPVIAGVAVPTLFVAGRESEFWPSEHAAASAALNPLAASTVIDKDGHAANIEQPTRFNERMLAFLAR